MTRAELIYTDFLSAIICRISVICMLFLKLTELYKTPNYSLINNYPGSDKLYLNHWNADDTGWADLHWFFISDYLPNQYYLHAIF